MKLNDFNIKPDLILEKLRVSQNLEYVRLTALLYVARLARSQELIKAAENPELKKSLQRRYSLQKSRNPLGRMGLVLACELGLLGGLEVLEIQDARNSFRMKNISVRAYVEPTLSDMMKIAEPVLVSMLTDGIEVSTTLIPEVVQTT